MKTYPIWPGEIAKPPAIVYTPKRLQKKEPSTSRPGYHYIFFYGSHNHAWIEDEKIFPHSDKLLEDAIKKKKSILYSNAVEDIIVESDTLVQSLRLIRKYRIQCDVTNFYINNPNPEKLIKDLIKKNKLLTKPPTTNCVKRGRPPKKNECKETKNSQKSNLKVEASDRKLRSSQISSCASSQISSCASSQISSCVSSQISSCTSNDCSAPISITLNGDQVAIFPPLDNQLVLGQNFELHPEPPVDLSKPNTALQNKSIEPISVKIGCIGLGMMGKRIIKNFLQSGHDVSVCHHIPEQCKQFIDAGAKQFSTPAELVHNCDIIFCCVSTPLAVRRVVLGVNGILDGLVGCQPGTKSYVELTSLTPLTSRLMSQGILYYGGIYLEAPIIGSRSLAEESSLAIFGAGDHELFLRCSSCFSAISKECYFVGEEVGVGSRLNLIHNMLIGTANVSLAETMALVEQMNIRKSQFLEILKFSNINCPLFVEKGQAIVENKFVTNNSLRYQLQNLKMALIYGDKFAHHLPLASAANEVYKKCSLLDYYEHDISAAYLGIKN
ncbi:putative oxidoreductase GLYR1 homolog [Trichonephila clavata]|uniref:Cytokine-like nuclear factor N-PAC n=1 Tax=Trichonephila clavata TaxID=2740835 RepID=A0A8X6GBB3_TRICU|nr:putative oxidoreductase GLYR1 homolog [Trichonephila clavata]